MGSYVLYEHSAGYALFKNIAMEDIGSQLDEVSFPLKMLNSLISDKS